MKKPLVSILVVAACLVLAAPRSEADPARMRFLVHGHHDLTSRLALSADLIPSGNLLGELAPLGHLILDVKATSWLTISPVIGYAFKPNEVIASLQLTIQTKYIWSWIDFETQPQSWSTYWFAQVDYSPLKWLSLGLEEESWGDLSHFSLASHGGGPNIIFRWNIFGLDLAMHVRESTPTPANVGDPPGPSKTGAEFVARIHLFF